MSIYVEILIRAPIDQLWEHTQNPALHERWDLRFTSIRYLPRASEKEPQQFSYSTRIGFGMEISGTGSSVANRDEPGRARTSVLEFGSNDPRSLILKGGGYWKYVPVDGGIRFLTRYDYSTRFGLFGKLFDRVIFRPLMGWATAWSFDRLRLWLEKGIEPAAAFRQALTHGLSRLALAAIFFYQGLVPKLLAHDAAEIALLRAGGVPDGHSDLAQTTLGWLEIVFAFLLLFCWRKAWPAMLSAFLVLVATAYVVLCAPRFLTGAFNPVTLNLGVAVLALIDWFNVRGLPSAGNCLREEPK